MQGTVAIAGGNNSKRIKTCLPLLSSFAKYKQLIVDTEHKSFSLTSLDEANHVVFLLPSLFDECTMNRCEAILKRDIPAIVCFTHSLQATEECNDYMSELFKLYPDIAVHADHVWYLSIAGSGYPHEWCDLKTTDDICEWMLATPPQQ